ncbi:hypothetical protein [Streptomyces atrovirens]|uniref:Uncharacterized protein n=1 Tax=Streptomyces atrovirens TaxID=285556 RepID=A0ABW0DY36_9ACTN
MGVGLLLAPGAGDPGEALQRVASARPRRLPVVRAAGAEPASPDGVDPVRRLRLPGDEAGGRPLARGVRRDVLGEMTDGVLGGGVQHLVEVPGREDPVAGTVVAVRGADGRRHGAVEQVGTGGRPVPGQSDGLLRDPHGGQ